MVVGMAFAPMARAWPAQLGRQRKSVGSGQWKCDHQLSRSHGLGDDIEYCFQSGWKTVFAGVAEDKIVYQWDATTGQKVR